MPAPLPKNPKLEHLAKSAKRLLAAQRQGDPRCCPLLRRLGRFADASDDEILAADLKLADTQHLVATHYGFSNWGQLRRDLMVERTTNAISLESVRRSCRPRLPTYAGAGLPLAVVAALNGGGIDIDCISFVASSGWAFSFGYQYDDISPAFMAVRGDPAADGPLEVFSFVPEILGFGYESARTDQPDELWPFCVTHSDAGRPIISEHLDGGLISGHHEQEGRRQLYFDGPVGSGWIDVDRFQPYAVYVLVPEGKRRPEEEIVRQALRRALAKGSSHEWKGVPQGMAALESYLADVADQSLSFEECEEWFCWAAFERLMARRCSEVWLQRSAGLLPGKAADLALRAADCYGRAFVGYDRYCDAVTAGKQNGVTLHERARSPERIAAIVPPLEQGIAAEAEGIALLAQAVASLD